MSSLPSYFFNFPKINYILTTYFLKFSNMFATYMLYQSSCSSIIFTGKVLVQELYQNSKKRTRAYALIQLHPPPTFQSSLNICKKYMYWYVLSCFKFKLPYGLMVFYLLRKYWLLKLLLLRYY